MQPELALLPPGAPAGQVPLRVAVDAWFEMANREACNSPSSDSRRPSRTWMMGTSSTRSLVARAKKDGSSRS